MNQSNHILNDLVSATRDGKEFYEYAATRVGSLELEALFVRLANVKGDIVDGLSDEVRAAGGKPAKKGTWAGDYNRFYGEVRAHLGDKDYAYVAQLEESYDQLLKAFDRALKDDELTTSARTVIVSLLPEVRSCHDIMRAHKKALKKAA